MNRETRPRNNQFIDFCLSIGYIPTSNHLDFVRIIPCQCNNDNNSFCVGCQIVSHQKVTVSIQVTDHWSV